MSRVYLCLGNSTRNPYEFPKARTKVGSVEELCYFLKENTYLLEEGMLNKKLTEWIRSECGLPELSQKLNAALKEKEPMEAFLETLFSYTGYYSREETMKTIRVIRISAGVSTSEKQKARADYFLENKKYVLALQEYEDMLEQMEGTNPAFLGKLYHNRGAAQAGLFLFEKAAQSFETAYRMTGSKESLLQYLGAMRFYLTEKEYVPFLADHPEFYEASLELESRWKEAQIAWYDSDVRREADNAVEAHDNGVYDVSSELVARKTAALHNAYRACVVQ